MATAKIVELTDSNTCKLCDNAFAKYSCPRCNVLYCSVSCYRSENHIQCSESFYEDCVKKEMALSGSDTKSSKGIEEILQQMSSNTEDAVKSDDSDDDEYSSLYERFQNIDLEKECPDKIWEKLTKDEQQEFIAFLRFGDISKLIPPWEPWWLSHNDKKVVELDSNSETKEMKKNCPKIVHIKHFSSLSAKPASECVKYNTINVLASYVLVCRYFNGEIYDFEKEASTCMITLSLCLKFNENFTDYETAIKSVEQTCVTTEWILVDSENIKNMRADVEHILKGPSKSNKKYYILCALSDFHCLLIQALKKKDDDDKIDSFSKKFPNDGIPKVHLESNEKMRQCLRKIDYFLSYTKDCFTFD